MRRDAMFGIAFSTFKLFHCAHAALHWNNDTHNTSLTVSAYNAWPWAVNCDDIFCNKNLRIVPLDLSYGLFNPCEENSFTVENLSPLINKFHSNGNHSSALSTAWIGLIRGPIIHATCPGVLPMHLNFQQYTGPLAQKVGASALIYAFHNSVPWFLTIPPSVDITEHSVKGVKVNIPVFLLNYLGEFDTWNYEESGNTTTASFTEVDTNPYKILFDKATSPYKLAWGILVCLNFTSAALAAYSFVRSLQGSAQTTRPSNAKSSPQRQQYLLKNFVLLSTLLTSLVACVISIDPLGAYGLLSYTVGRMFFSGGSVCSIVSDLGTLIYLFDIYSVFKASRKMQTSIPFAVKYKFAIIGVLLVSMTMCAVDVSFEYLGIYGLLGSSTLLISAAYNFLLHFTCSVVFIILTRLFDKELKSALAPAIAKLTAKMTAPGGTSTMNHARHTAARTFESGILSPVRRKTSAHPAEQPASAVSPELVKGFQRLQFLILVSVIARAILIMSLVSLALDLISYAPSFYAATFLGCGYGLYICYTSQIFAARVRISIAKRTASTREQAGKASSATVRKESKVSLATTSMARRTTIVNNKPALDMVASSCTSLIELKAKDVSALHVLSLPKTVSEKGPASESENFEK